MLLHPAFRQSRSRFFDNCLQRFRAQLGLAALIAMIAVSVFSLIGLYVSLNATTEVRVGDNYEDQLQARYAALAGINHARELLRGLDHNALLKGPNGVADSTYPSTQAGQFAFRNWISWADARSLNIIDPSGTVGGIPDDGLMNDGSILVPKIGIAMTATNPYGSGKVTCARYFLKVTNDPGDAGGPFSDSNGIIVVRSTGVARTVRETGGGVVRANSVAVYEAKFKRTTSFDLDAPVVLEGDTVSPAKPNMFSGNAFNINGGTHPYGIGTIDPSPSNGNDPTQQVIDSLDSNQYNNIDGSCCTGSVPAVGSITPKPGDENYNLMDPNYVYDFMYHTLPNFADAKYTGDQAWAGGNAPNLGHYDPTKPRNAAGQDFRITYVNGNVSLSGNLEGGGILAVTGSITGNGSLTWNGLILVIGSGSAMLAGMNVEIKGGLYVVNVSMVSGSPAFGKTSFSISGNSKIVANDTVMNLATDTIPAKQLSMREITTSMDP